MKGPAFSDWYLQRTVKVRKRKKMIPPCQNFVFAATEVRRKKESGFKF